ncbi:MAG: LON peptidase substrate-binding domain-containing protein, partial [Ilumatobacteraceae bacterium]
LPIGVIARMVQVAAMGGGQFAVVTVGTRRIRVTRWLADDPYPLAEIEDWPDEVVEVSTDGLEATASRARSCAGLAVEMGDRSAVPEIELTGDPSVDTFLLAAISPFGPADLYALLSASDPAVRLELIDRLLDDVEAGLRFRLG